MEKIPAAYAMEWSIELEKSLRSNKPGKSFEAIQKIGSNLEWWNSEDKLTMAEYNLFGLLPGEDKFYANAILLRLVDAFSSGDKQMKHCIVKLFMSEYKHRKKRKKNDGVLSKSRFTNYLEVLRRVKVVFEDGDVEVRSMVFALFGCWADFAHDSAEIRYIVLSSLVSSDVVEVKASLFAAGCFCELSDDFACVVLEILVSMVSSSEISKDIRMAGMRSLAKLGVSHDLATRAYETGLKLLSDSSEDDLSVVLLISLSKIAAKSTLLTSTQVKTLFSFLSQDKSFCLQGTSLKCLCFILAGGAHTVHASADAIETLLCKLNEFKMQPALECVTLQILHKILLQNVFSFSYHDMLELLSKLLIISEDGIQCSTFPNGVLRLYILIDVYSKFIGRADSEVDGEKLHQLASRMVTSIVYRIFHLIESQAEQEIKSLLNLLIHLVQARMVFAGLVLEKILNSVKFMSNGKTALPELVSETGKSKTDTTTKHMLYICKLLLYCLENAYKTSSLTTEVHVSMKLLVEDAHRYGFFDCYTRTIFSLSYLSFFTSHCFWNNIEESNHFHKLGTSDQKDFVQHEISSLECSNILLTRKDNWLAYKVGKYSACHGTWFVAAFTFQKLIKLVQSRSCYFWLALLAEFAHTEMQVQFLFLPKQCSDFLNWLDSSGISISTVSLSNYVDKLFNACKIFHSSKKVLNITSRSASDFGFQCWFLSLRANVLKSVDDMLQLLDVISEPIDNGKQQTRNSLALPLAQISLRFRRLSQEFDLVATSFIGMDYKGLMIISSLALSCSLLAFSVGFAICIPNIQAKRFTLCGSVKFEESLYPVLILDVLSRLWHVDRETSFKLMLLLDACGQPKGSLIPQPQNNMLDICYETRSLITACGFAVRQAVGLQNDANRLHNSTQHAIDGLSILSKITKKWMQIPFQTPTYFFRIRPPVSSQLYSSNEDARHRDRVSVRRGSHLSLNICLQLRNMPQDFPSRLSKLYCILSTSVSYQIHSPMTEETEQAELGFQDWGTDDMIDMNKKLFQYVIRRKSKATLCKSNDSGDCQNVEVYACLKSNAKGQGFSNCLLDISAFPVGSYRIKWHSCCIDNQGSYWSLLPTNHGLILTVQ